MSEKNPQRYDHATVFPAEGARAALLTCLRCGAAVLRDPRDDQDATKIHDRWHRAQKPAKA